MAIAFVLSEQVLEVDAQSFQWPNYPNGITKQIPCLNIEIVNSFWRIPVTLGNRVIGYNHLVATDSSKPTPDSVKVLRVKDTRDLTEYEFAIADGDNITSNTFTDKCNGCCGPTPVMDNVTIPNPILQEGPQSTASDGSNTFIFAFPANPNGLEYAIPYPWFNGAAPGTAYAGAGLTTVADIVTWATSNWSDYGTWTNPTTNILKLVSPTSAGIYVQKAGMQVTLVPTHYCLTLNSTPDNVNGIKIDGQKYTFPAVYADRNNRQALINAIQKFFPFGVFTTAIAHKIDILTTQLPQEIEYNGSAVSGLTFGAGACS